MSSKFVKLTRAEGWGDVKTYIWVNPANVAAIESWTSEDKAALHLTSGTKLIVQESPAAVREALVFGQVVRPVTIEDEDEKTRRRTEEVVDRMPAT